MTALVGPSGAGKTTIANLIPRLYDATGGVVEIDGQDVREVTLESLRRKIGFVMQEPYLFNATIRENLVYGSPDVTREEVEETCKTAYIHDFIMGQDVTVFACGGSATSARLVNVIDRPLYDVIGGFRFDSVPYCDLAALKMAFDGARDGCFDVINNHMVADERRGTKVSNSVLPVGGLAISRPGRIHRPGHDLLQDVAHLSYSLARHAHGVTVHEGDQGSLHVTVNNSDAKVTVNTYGVYFQKVDKDGEALSGATFTLYEAAADGKADTTKPYGTSTSGDDGYIYFSGLADGKTYVAVETTVPAGKQRANDISVTIDASSATGDNPATSGVTEDNYQQSASVTDPDQGILPMTGSVGTLGLTAAGVMLMVFIACLFTAFIMPLFGRNTALPLMGPSTFVPFVLGTMVCVSDD